MAAKAPIGASANEWPQYHWINMVDLIFGILGFALFAIIFAAIAQVKEQLSVPAKLRLNQISLLSLGL